MVPFSEKLEQILEGKLTPESVLEPFLDGLNHLITDFEASLEHQPEELIDLLGGYLDAIAEGVEQCEHLAQDCLDSELDQEVYEELTVAHAHLEQLLSDFHRESWVLKGPTAVDWVNMVVAAVEAFLSGSELQAHLKYLLDEHIKDLQSRRMRETSPNLEPFLNICRELSTWTEGQGSLRGAELEELLARFISHASMLEDYLAQNKVSLEQVLSLLQEDLPPEEVEHLVASALAELEHLRQEMTRIQDLVSEKAKTASADYLEILNQLEIGLEQHINWEQTDPDGEVGELYNLYDELETAQQELATVLSDEGMVACPSCGEKNTRSAKMCKSCGFILPASLGEDTVGLDLTEGENVQMDEQNVLRFRGACRDFQSGVIQLEQFLHELETQHGQLQATRKSFERNMGSESPPDEGKSFLDSLARLEQIFRSMAKVELSNDLSIDSNLSLYEQEVKFLRDLKKTLT